MKTKKNFFDSKRNDNRDDDFSIDRKEIKRREDKKKNRNFNNALKSKNIRNIMEYYDEDE